MPAGLAETLQNLFSSSLYQVDGSSMSPALNHGDRVLAARSRRPYQRGDIVVFRQPLETGNGPVDVYIKRIIGLPQEEIFLDESIVRINGSVFPESYLKAPSDGLPMTQERETARLWITGPGEYFVMGDHRVNSQDSRSFGPVDSSLVLGRVWLRYWPAGAWGLIPLGG